MFKQISIFIIFLTAANSFPMMSVLLQSMAKNTQITNISGKIIHSRVQQANFWRGEHKPHFLDKFWCVAERGLSLEHQKLNALNTLEKLIDRLAKNETFKPDAHERQELTQAYTAVRKATIGYLKENNVIQ